MKAHDTRLDWGLVHATNPSLQGCIHSIAQQIAALQECNIGDTIYCTCCEKYPMLVELFSNFEWKQRWGKRPISPDDLFEGKEFMTHTSDFTPRSRQILSRSREIIDFAKEGDRLEEHARSLHWGTYGKNCDRPEVAWVPLCDLATEHLENILITQNSPLMYRLTIIYLLRQRYKNDPDMMSEAHGYSPDLDKYPTDVPEEQRPRLS